MQTEHQLNWEYGAAGAWCCHWKNFEVTNCFAYKVYVYKRHRSITMQSTAGNVAHCTYKDGACILKDSSALIWDVNLQEHCQYLPWKSIPGDRLGTNWIAEDHNLALPGPPMMIQLMLVRVPAMETRSSCRSRVSHSKYNRSIQAPLKNG